MRMSLAVAALAAVTLSAAAARAERPRVAVMEMAGPKVAPDLRQRVTRTVQEGLIASGADVVEGMPAAATGPGGAPCDGPGCVTAVARAAVASYVVRGTLEVVGRTYGLRLEILDGKSGDLIESREDRCEICTEGEALEMAGVSASALKVQAFKKKPGGAAGEGALAAGAPPAAVPPATATVGIEARAETPPPHGHRRLGWIGVGVGAAAVIAGVTLVAIDGNPTCDGPNTCTRLRDTQGLGIAALAGGALAAAVGVLVLTGKF
jgi:hypothetical protein